MQCYCLKNVYFTLMLVCQLLQLVTVAICRWQWNFSERFNPGWTVPCFIFLVLYLLTIFKLYMANSPHLSSSTQPKLKFRKFFWHPRKLGGRQSSLRTVKIKPLKRSQTWKRYLLIEFCTQCKWQFKLNLLLHCWSPWQHICTYPRMKLNSPFISQIRPHLKATPSIRNANFSFKCYTHLSHPVNFCLFLFLVFLLTLLW